MKQVKSIGSPFSRSLGLHIFLIRYMYSTQAYIIATFEECKPGTREFGRFRSIVYSKITFSIHNLTFFLFKKPQTDSR